MMRNPLSKKITGIEPSGIRKFFDLVSEMPDAISLGVGEPDFDTPWRIREEGIYTLEQGKTFYTSNAGLKDLKIEISKYLERKIHVEYDPDHEIMVTVGGSEGIDVALRAMLDPGDEVLIPQPSYVSYEPCAILANGTPVIIELKEENEFRLTKEELEAAITPKTKLLVLPFPNNPTGAVMERKDLEEIAEVIKEHDIFVLSDEIYAELTYCGEHVSIASLPGMKERTITLNGFSKAYSMTGWRLGYAACNEEIVKTVNKLHQHVVTCATSFVQKAGVVALKEEKNEVTDMVKEYQRRRDYAVKAINEIDGLSCRCPKGAFYIFINIEKLGMTGQEFAPLLLENAKVALVPGDVFGTEGDHYVRMSFANSYENVVEGCKRLKEFVEKLRRNK